jgi:uncharacterized membrane protein YphA (DoxX/SURF4 family)
MTLGDALLTAAITLDLWSRPVAALLALFVVGCLTFVASAWGEG